ncbi:MAG: hypothetical protein WCI04_06115 [archaeon]
MNNQGITDKRTIYDSYYRHQRPVNRLDFKVFSKACDLLAKNPATRAEIARRLSTPNIKVAETRIRRLAVFLNAKNGNKSYARRAKSLRLSTKFPDAVKRYLELRRNQKLSISRAAEIIGVNRYTALDWERSLLNPTDRQKLEKNARSNLNVHPKRSDMRLLLAVRNFDMTFKYPPKAIMNALGVKLDAIRTANAMAPAIRTKPDIDNVANRFRGGGRNKIPQLSSEAKEQIPLLRTQQRAETALINMRKILGQSQNKRFIFETKVINSFNQNGLAQDEYKGLKKILERVLLSQNYTAPVNEIHALQQVPRFVLQHLLITVNKIKASDGAPLLLINNATIKLNPDTAKLIA